MWHHPKYYKELKEFGKRGDRGKPTAASPDTDQAISLKARDGECERAPGPGLKRQASSTKLREQQATSVKPRGTSVKLQAASIKLQDS